MVDRRSLMFGGAPRTQTPGSDFTPTEPGDPDYSPSRNPDSQAFYPAAAAEKSLHTNARYAQNTLASAQAAGADISQPQYDPIRDVAVEGWLERAKTFGEGLVNFIDGPFQAANLLVQDLFSDGSEGRDITVHDYADAVWFGIDDQDTFKEETGLDPRSGSQTLDMLGWHPVGEDEEGLGASMERVARGITDFGLRVGIDPLTYVTFGLSGLGKNVAKATGLRLMDDVTEEIMTAYKAGVLDPEKLTSAYGRKLARGLDDEVDNWLNKIDFENMNPDTRARIVDWLQKHGHEGIEFENEFALLAAMQENATELALRDRIQHEVVAPLIRRDFKAIKNLAPEAFEEMPAYAMGGVRLSVPFTKRQLTQGVLVPGTQGLGRKVVGDPLRKLSERLRDFSPGAYGKLADNMDNILNAVDRPRALLKGLGSERIEGWQWAIARNAMDRLDNVAHKETQFSQLNAMKNDLIKMGEEANFNEARIAAFWPEVTNRLEKRAAKNTLDEMEELVDPVTGRPHPGQQQLYQDIDDKINEITDFLRQTYETYHKAISDVNPVLKKKYIDGYTPHNITDEIAQIFGKMAGEGATVTRKELERLGRSENRGHQLFAQIVNAITRGGRIETQLGAARAMDPRDVGRVSALTLTDNGTVQLDQQFLAKLFGGDTGMEGRVLAGEGQVLEDVVSTRYISVTELNEALEPVVRDVAARNNVHLPKNWDGKVFNENPLETAIGYIDNLDDALATWGMVEGLRAAGLSFKHANFPNVQGILQGMYANALKNTEKVVLRTDRAVGEIAGEAAEAAPAPRPGAKLSDQEQALAKRGREMWTGGRSDRIRRNLEKIIAGEEPDIKSGAVTRETYDALIKWWQSSRRPTKNMTRLLGKAEVEDIAGQGIGGRVDISMASVDTGGFKTRGGQQGDTDWVMKFEDGTPTAALPESIEATGEWLTSGRFEITGIDEASKTVNVRHVEDILPGSEAAKIQELPGRPRGVSLDAEGTEAWRTSAERIRVLRGFEQASEESAGIVGVPLKALNDTQAAKLGTPDEAAALFRLLDGGKQGFRDLRRRPMESIEQIRPDQAGTGPAGWRVTESAARGRTEVFNTEAGRPALVMHIDDAGQFGVDVVEGANPMAVARALYDRIDDLVEEGEVALNAQSVENLLNHEQMTNAGADMIYGYLRYKMRQLDGATQEFLTKQPEEVLGFVDAYDQFVDMYNQFFRGYGAIINEDGTLDTSRALFAGDELFENDFKQLREAAKSMSDVHGFDTAVKLFRNMPDPMGLAVDEGFVNPAIFALGGPALEGLSLQTDIAKWLRQASRNQASIYTPEGIAALKMGTNSVLQWWKAMATIARPGFHIRNVIGGIWNNMIVGVGPEAYRKTSVNGVKIRHGLRAGEDFDQAIKRVPVDEQPYWQAAWDHEVLNGFATSEFRGLTTAERKHRMAWAKVWDIDDFALSRMGGHFMEGVEDFLRFSAFRTWYDPAKPSTGAVAAEMARAVHFDYMNLTPFETKVKQIVPFFVWIRRNLPLQIGQYMENPRMIQRYTHMMRSIDDAWADEEGGDMPIGDHYSAYAASTGFTVNKDTPFWARAIIDPDLPVRDLLDLPRPEVGELFEWAMNQVGPHLSTVVNLNEQREFGDVNAPAGMNAVLQSLAAVGLYDRTMQGDVRVPYHWRTLQETILPFSRDVVNPLTGGSADPRQRARAGISPDDGFLEGGAKTLGSTVLGAMGVRFTTPGDARSAGFRSNEHLQELIKKLRLQGEVPPSESSATFNPDPFGIRSGTRG